MFSQTLPHIAQVYIRWMFLRALLHRGWWLVTSLYLVTVANLDPLQLVALGTAQGLVVLIFEIPTGVMADTISRKWSIVISHVFMGAAMLATGLVTSFAALMLTQMLWGLAWTFSSGADVAWMTDELDEPSSTGRYLGMAARWELVGSLIGLAAIGTLAFATSLSTAMVLAGTMMLLLTLYVVLRFTEQRFSPTRSHRLASSRSTFASGWMLVRSNRTILVVLLVTFLVNGADEAFTRLYARHLIDLGLPTPLAPIAWLTLLGMLTLLAGAVALRVVENRLSAIRSLNTLYLVGCLLGASGIALFALAPSPVVAMCGMIVVQGIAWSIVRIVAVVLINEQSGQRTRATLQSFLSQAENLGEVTLGLGLGVLARMAGLSMALLSAALIVVVAATCIRIWRCDH